MSYVVRKPLFAYANCIETHKIDAKWGKPDEEKYFDVKTVF